MISAVDSGSLLAVVNELTVVTFVAVVTFANVVLLYSEVVTGTLIAE